MYFNIFNIFNFPQSRDTSCPPTTAINVFKGVSTPSTDDYDAKIFCSIPLSYYYFILSIYNIRNKSISYYNYNYCHYYTQLIIINNKNNNNDNDDFINNRPR